MSRKADPDKLFKQGARNDAQVPRSKDGSSFLDDIVLTAEERAEIDRVIREHADRNPSNQPKR
jgi:hypothetical protein